MKMREHNKRFGITNKYLCILLCLLIAISACGCGASKTGQGETPGEASGEAQDPLVVFYNDGVLNTFLMNFMISHPEVEIKAQQYGLQGEDLEEAIKNYGAPDVILISNASGPNSADLEDWYEKGIIVNLNDYYLEDEDLDASAYLPGTFELCKAEKGELYALPMAVMMSFMTLRESNWVGSAFEELREGYTGQDVVNAIQKELEKSREQGEFFVAESIGNPMEWLYRMGGVQQGEDGININEELFEQLYEICFQAIEERRETAEYYAGAFSERGAVSTGIDPSLYNGKYLMSVWGYGGLPGAPQLLMSYAKSANTYENGEATKAVWCPSIEDGSSYGAEVRLFGMVGAESSRKAEGYELLKAMLDMPYDLWGKPGSLQSVTYCPVHKENAIRLLEEFEADGDESLEVMKAIGEEKLYTMERQRLSEEEREEIEAVLNRISFLYYEDPAWEEGGNIFFRYYDAQIRDYQYCYQEVMHLLNPDSDKWQILDPESIKTEESAEEALEGGTDTEPDEELKAALREKEIGNEITFGLYEQDNNIENGSEGIEWIVLDIEDGKMLLLSKYCLDMQAYEAGSTELKRKLLAFSSDHSNTGTGGDFLKSSFEETWKKSDICQWLNHDFLEEAFSQKEKSLIIPTTIEVQEHMYVEGYAVLSGMTSTTVNQVFLLSKEEALNYFPDAAERIAQPTPYAAVRTGDTGGVKWWLRTKSKATMVYTVNANGEINDHSEFIGSGRIGVRPAIWVDIS